MKTAADMKKDRTQPLRRFGIGDLLKSAFAVFAKDVRSEIRARHSLNAILLFAITSTVAVSFALGAWGAMSDVASATLWLVLYFSAMSGLSRSFVHEQEMHTAETLRLAANPSSVYLGKLAFNLVLLFILELVIVPLFVTLTGCAVANWGLFLLILALGSLGLGAGATVAAAMIARTQVKGSLFAVICFPILIPVLAVAMHGTNFALEGRMFASALSDARLIAYYCGAVITASIMLFRFIWED